MNIGSPSQPTDFALDVLGRYVCNTFDEALGQLRPGLPRRRDRCERQVLPPRGDMRPFDFIIIGGGTFGAAVAEHLWFRSTGRSERILVLEAGPFLLAEHMQNLPSLGLGNEVWGLSWNADAELGYPWPCVLRRRPLDCGGAGGRHGCSIPKRRTSWPQAVLDDLNAKKLPNGDNGYFRQSGQQIGVTATNDLHFRRVAHGLARAAVHGRSPAAHQRCCRPATLPDAPTVEILDTAPTLDDLAALLGVNAAEPSADRRRRRSQEA